MQGHQKQIEKIIMIISLLIFLAAPAAMADLGRLSVTQTSMSAAKKKSIPLETDFIAPFRRALRGRFQPRLRVGEQGLQVDFRLLEPAARREGRSGQV